MLTRTFLHLPGIGPERERNLWAEGKHGWDDLLAERDLFDEAPASPLEQALSESRRRFAEGDAAWFAQALGSRHAWRLAADFDDGRIAYLDIETDGAKAGESFDEDGPGGTTLVGVWDGRRARVFVRGRDLDKVPEYLAPYKAVATFNGKSFDVPYLERRFGKGFFRGAHLDLMPIGHMVELRGGLKKIEEALGLRRPDGIRRMSGYDAVRLWTRYRQGETEALEPLVRYNLADTMNLQVLLREVYNRAVSEKACPFRRFDHMTEPGFDAAREAEVRRVMAER